MDDERHHASEKREASMSEFDPGQAGQLAAEAVAAGALGVLGAFARVAAAGDEKPMLRKALLIRMGGDFSMGLGVWLGLSALGHDGWWVMFAAWTAGALGYAVVHDIALRILNRKIGP
jgi:hypothetical protein